MALRIEHPAAGVTEVDIIYPGEVQIRNSDVIYAQHPGNLKSKVKLRRGLLEIIVHAPAPSSTVTMSSRVSGGGKVFQSGGDMVIDGDRVTSSSSGQSAPLIVGLPVGMPCNRRS